MVGQSEGEAVNPELLKLMAGGAGQKAAPGPNPMAAAAPGNSAPAGGPMSTPQPKEGVEQAAKIDVAMAGKLLTKALASTGILSKEGKAINDALKVLIRAFGPELQKAEPLIPAELLQLVQQIPGAGGGSPAAAAMGGIPPSKPAMPAAAAA